MQKETLIILQGFILILLPYLGIPDDWKRIIVIVFGVIFVLLGYLLLRDKFISQTDLGNGERGTDAFVETTTSLFKD